MQDGEILHYLVLGKAPGTASKLESDQLAQIAVALALQRNESEIRNIADKLGIGELNLTDELGGLALSLGRQLSHKFYIGYTVGLLESASIARLRYFISDAWSFETELANETRAAIKYRVERD